MAKRKRGERLKGEEKRSFNRKNLSKLLGIFKFTLPYKNHFILGLICLLFSSSVLLAFPYFAGILIDVASGKGSNYFDNITQVAVVLLAILFGQSVFSFLRVYLFAQVTERAMADIRYNLYQKMVFLPLSFFDNARVGDLISRITSDVSLLQQTFSVTLAELFRQMLTLVVGVAVIFFIAPRLTLFMLAIFPILVILALLFGKYIRKLSRKTQDALAAANVVVEETLQAIPVVKAFTNELLETDRFKTSMEHVVGTALLAARFRGIFISFIIFALFGGLVAVMWYGATLVQSQDLTVGSLLSFILYTTFIGGSIAGLGDIFSQIQRAIGASERVLETLSEQSEAAGVPAESLKLQGHIVYRGLTFAYPGRREVKVLKNVSFEISPGERVALVGHSGAGKSTIVQLLMRFYPVGSGKIQVDGTNIDHYFLEAYRKNIGIVPQEVVLFGGSIKENIAYGNPQASMQEITAAASQANALEFIEKFPEGFNTLVGERGMKLSGGQKQRIAIARAILKDPTILILDEATSSLDTASENLVQQALDQLMENRTTIIIAHRLSTIRKVNKIFVIQDGEIAESGSHQELSLKDDSVYSNLLRLQFELN